MATHRRRSRLLKPALILAGTAAVAIAALTITPSAHAIVGGSTVVEDGVNPQPAVVKLFGDRGLLRDPDVCTGTLIASDRVLTAQHCTNKSDQQGRPFDPAEMTVAFRRGPANPPFERTAADIIRMPNYLQAPGGDDIAIIRLDSPVTDVAPIPLLAGVEQLTSVDRFGYGTADKDGLRSRLRNKGSAPSDTFDVRRSTETVVAPPEAALIVPACPELDSRGCWTPDNTLLTIDQGGGHSTDGDSGGPAMATTADGRYALAGVTMGSGSGNGHHYGFSNRVDTASAAWAFISEHVPDLRTAPLR